MKRKRKWKKRLIKFRREMNLASTSMTVPIDNSLNLYVLRLLDYCFKTFV